VLFAGIAVRTGYESLLAAAAVAAVLVGVGLYATGRRVRSTARGETDAIETATAEPDESI
jgi:hypothetical protein